MVLRELSTLQLIILSLVAHVAAAICPAGCSCDEESLSVDCTGANLGVIPITLNPFLLRLVLRKNVVTQLKEQLYPYSDLERLDLSDNEVAELDASNFHSVPRLGELSLARNRIEHLNGRVFDHLRALRSLDLSGNLVSRIANGTFRTLSALRDLDLSRNRISHLQPGAFEELRSLRRLHLESNSLARVPSEALRPLLTLAEVYLGSNGISSLPEGSFGSKSELRVLDLSGNRLADVSRGAFLGIERLEALSLADAGLEDVPVGSLSPFKALAELRFGRNPVEALRAEAFLGLHHLRLLDLAGCSRLRAIHPGALQHLPRLHTLLLNGTRSLDRLEAGALLPAPSLREVSFHGSALVFLPEAAGPWNQLALLDLSSAPLSCRCDLRWLLQLSRASNGVLAFCDTPQALSGRPLGELTDRDIGCVAAAGRLASPEAVIAICTVLPLLLLALSFALVWLKFRRRIHLTLKQFRSRKESTAKPCKTPGCGGASVYQHHRGPAYPFGPYHHHHYHHHQQQHHHHHQQQHRFPLKMAPVTEL